MIRAALLCSLALCHALDLCSDRGVARFDEQIVPLIEESVVIDGTGAMVGARELGAGAKRFVTEGKILHAKFYKKFKLYRNFRHINDFTEDNPPVLNEFFFGTPMTNHYNFWTIRKSTPDLIISTCESAFTELENDIYGALGAHFSHHQERTLLKRIQGLLGIDYTVVSSFRHHHGLYDGRNHEFLLRDLTGDEITDQTSLRDGFVKATRTSDGIAYSALVADEEVYIVCASAGVNGDLFGSKDLVESFLLNLKEGIYVSGLISDAEDKRQERLNSLPPSPDVPFSEIVIKATASFATLKLTNLYERFINPTNSLETSAYIEDILRSIVKLGRKHLSTFSIWPKASFRKTRSTVDKQLPTRQVTIVRPTRSQAVPEILKTPGLAIREGRKENSRVTASDSKKKDNDSEHSEVVWFVNTRFPRSPITTRSKAANMALDILTTTEDPFDVILPDAPLGTKFHPTHKVPDANIFSGRIEKPDYDNQFSIYQWHGAARDDGYVPDIAQLILSDKANFALEDPLDLSRCSPSAKTDSPLCLVDAPDSVQGLCASYLLGSSDNETLCQWKPLEEPELISLESCQDHSLIQGQLINSPYETEAAVTCGDNNVTNNLVIKQGRNILHLAPACSLIAANGDILKYGGLEDVSLTFSGQRFQSGVNEYITSSLAWQWFSEFLGDDRATIFTRTVLGIIILTISLFLLVCICGVILYKCGKAVYWLMCCCGIGMKAFRCCFGSNCANCRSSDTPNIPVVPERLNQREPLPPVPNEEARRSGRGRPNPMRASRQVIDAFRRMYTRPDGTFDSNGASEFFRDPREFRAPLQGSNRRSAANTGLMEFRNAGARRYSGTEIEMEPLN